MELVNMRHDFIVAKLKLTNDVRQAVKEFQRFYIVILRFFPSSSSSDRDPPHTNDELFSHRSSSKNYFSVKC